MDINNCVTKDLFEIADDVKLGELRAECKKKLESEESPSTSDTKYQLKQENESALQRRLTAEANTSDSQYVLTPHKPNYILLAAYNPNPNEAPFREAAPDADVSFDKVEAKFQISFKYLLVKNIIGDNGEFFFAYTNRSFWQVYNKDLSSPFRETNHEPEAWFQYKTNWQFWGITTSLVAFGIVHQSNGKTEKLSRSWNRLFANFVFEKDNFYFLIKPWLRIREDAETDDNPDITDYLGNFEFQSVYKVGKNNVGFMFRNNLSFSDNNGAYQLDWSYPIHNQLRVYVQWFNGYGESLIDYDVHVNTIGIGLKLTDYL